MIGVTNVPHSTAMEAEKYLAKYWLQEWIHTGPTGTPYDFILRPDGPDTKYADCKCSSHTDNLQVSTEWLKKRIDRGLGEMAVIGVVWHPHRRAGMEFSVLGWRTVSDIVFAGEKRDRPQTRYSKGGRFTFVSVDELQPMRTLPT